MLFVAIVSSPFLRGQVNVHAVEVSRRCAMQSGALFEGLLEAHNLGRIVLGIF